MFQIQQLLLTAATSIITAIITIANWSKLKDRATPLALAVAKSRSQWLKRLALGLVIIVIMVPVITWFLHHSSLRNALLLTIGAVMLLTILTLIILQQDPMARKKMIAYLILLIGALSFWIIYAMLPMGLTVFAQYNVDRIVWGMTIAPQWFQNINAVVIVIGGPLMIVFLKKICKHIYFSVPAQFSFSLLITGISMLLLPIGIHFANAQGLVSIHWIFWCYVLQSTGELMIGPIGYAMVGQLASQRLQGIFMGTWMMMVGISGVLSSYLSNYAAANVIDNNPLSTNVSYSHTFMGLGIASLVFGVIMVLLIPFLRKLINEHSHENIEGEITPPSV